MAKRSNERKNDATYYKSLNSLIDRLFEEAYRQQMNWMKLAERSGVSSATIRKLGRRQTNYPQFRTVELIAYALGGSVTFSKTQQWRAAIKIRWTPKSFDAKRKRKAA